MARRRRSGRQGNLLVNIPSTTRPGTIERGATESGVAGVRARVFNYPNRATGRSAATSGREKVGRRISMGGSGG